MPARKPRVLATPIDIFACGQYRIIEPYQYLIDNSETFSEIEYVMHDIEHKNELLDFEKELHGFDAVIVQRVAHPLLVEVLERFKQRGGKVVLDLDDDFFSLAQSNFVYHVWKPGSNARKALVNLLGFIDQLYISTPELYRPYQPFINCPVFIHENTLDWRKYKDKKPLRSSLPEDKTIIMWAGSTTHQEDLKMIYPVLQEILSKNPQAVFALCGNKEFIDWLDAPEDQKIFIPPVSFKQYYAIPSYADIFLTPVIISDFNHAKSELKVLEAAIWGIPCVSSPVAAYLRFNQRSNGQGNLIAKKNRQSEWIKQIQKLIDDKELRKNTGDIAVQMHMGHEYGFEAMNASRHESIKRLFS